MPVILHMALTEKRRALRVLCAVLIPIFLFLIISADSRLGMVGFSATLLLYLLFWAVERWRHHRDSIFGPALTLGFPAIALAFLAATFLIGRLHALVWGTGAHKYSNEGRLGQLAEGLPLVLKHPWGYGIGRGAETLGFTNPAGVLSIDNYYLLIALEFGIVGFFVFYGIFATAIYKGARQILNYKGDEEVFIAPIMIALVNFVIIKAVFSQVEGHGLIFTYLGWLLALLYRIRKRESLHPDAPSPAISDGMHRGPASPAGARKTLPLAKRPAD
jgi:O-antigen ligase